MRVDPKVKMDWKQVQAPLEQIENESLKANNALNDYFILGDGRSLNKLVERYQTAPKESPTNRLATLKKWSVTFEWQARIARQEEIIKQQERDEWQLRARELREREWKLTQALMDKAAQMLQFPLAEIEKHTKTEHSPDGKTIIKNLQIIHPAKWYFVDAAKVIQLASRVARLATGQETEHVKNDIYETTVTSDEMAAARQKARDFEKQFDELASEGGVPSDE